MGNPTGCTPILAETEELEKAKQVKLREGTREGREGGSWEVTMENSIGM